jgi:hypothetical protein
VAAAAAQQMFQRALVTSLGPGTKTPPKTQPAKKKNPSQTQAKHLKNNQELTSNTTTQRHTDSATHPRQIPQRAHTGQTGVTWAARDEQDPRVNSPKSKLRPLESLHGLVRHLGDSRNTSWGVHSQVIVHQSLPNQDSSKKSRQELL